MIAIIREAAASARSQPVASILTILMVAAMIVAVMLTTGRTVGAEQRVLGSIDSAGTRSIIVRAETDAGITADVLDRVGAIEGIEWAAGFSSAIDATNIAIPDGPRTAVRYAYGDQLEALGIPKTPVLPGELAYGSPTAIDRLGFTDRAGGILLTTGENYGVGGQLKTPTYLRQFEPLLIIPESRPSGEEPVNILVVIATTPDLVAPVSDALLSVLASTDSTKVTVETSEVLAQLRAIVQSQLGSFSRGLVIALLALTSALVAILLYGLVMLRRKDYGRRRALGATRGLIIGLLIAQTAILSAVGVALGLAIAVTTLTAGGEPVPSLAFNTALAVLAIATACGAALLPATLASRREPIRELRVP